jgi:hypothetical protein
MSITEPWTATIVLLTLLGSSALGMLVQRFLSERHTSHDTIALIHHVVVMLFTFAALVLGLLITSAKSSFDQVDNTVRSFAIRLIELDQVLREYGGEVDPIRSLLHTYAATVITTTWIKAPQSKLEYQAKQPSDSVKSPELEDLSNSIRLKIRELDPKDAMHRQLASECQRLMEQVVHIRWMLIEQRHTSISAPFYLVLVFWLVVVFGGFGLTAPHNVLTYTALAIAAISIASAIFVLLDFDRPFAGIFTVPAEPIRGALIQLSR